MCPVGGNVVHGKKVRFCEPESQELSTEDYERHRAEVAKEWTKQKPNSDHINVLLRDTFANRRSWVMSLPAGEFLEILKVFPCLEDGQFVSIVILCPQVMTVLYYCNIIYNVYCVILGIDYSSMRSGVSFCTCREERHHVGLVSAVLRPC